MHNLVSFFVMPGFALCNAAMQISFDGGLRDVTQGLALGLLLGKVIGVSLLSIIVWKLKLVPKPKGMRSRKLLGLGFVASIGFTMSLFITELAFDTQLHPEYTDEAKTGIIIASAIGGVLGFLILNTNDKSTE